MHHIRDALPSGCRAQERDDPHIFVYLRSQQHRSGVAQCLVVAEEPLERRHCDGRNVAPRDGRYRDHASRLTKGGGSAKNGPATMNAHQALLAVPLARFVHQATQDQKYTARWVTSARKHGARRIRPDVSNAPKPCPELLDGRRF
jgi:hypothetical protein